MKPASDEKDILIARQAQEIERLRRILDAHHISYESNPPQPPAALQLEEQRAPYTPDPPRETPSPSQLMVPKEPPAALPAAPASTLPLPSLKERSQDPRSSTWNVRPDQLPYACKRQLFVHLQGRMDVHPYRYVKKDGKAQWAPECAALFSPFCSKSNAAPAARKGISCKDCPHQDWTKYSPALLESHFAGCRYQNNQRKPYALGVYPLLANGTCWFLAFDFDCHEENAELKNWKQEVDILRSICRSLCIDCLVEVSRSGKGAHVWILFDAPVPASEARKFGKALLAKGSQSFNLESFHYYDRMFPTQDALPEGGLGNLIAMPWQGEAMRNNRTLFVDEDWQPYHDQYQALMMVQRLSPEQMQAHLRQWEQEGLLKAQVQESMGVYPWEAAGRFHGEDAPTGVKIRRANGIYIRKKNLAPRLLNQMRHMAAYENPVFRKHFLQDFSDLEQERYLYYAQDLDGYLRLPGGLWDALSVRFEQAGIACQVEDLRTGAWDGARAPLPLVFEGSLRDYQIPALEALLQQENGILHAATASGKTVIALQLIAALQVPTLIIVEREELLRQWKQAARRFLRYTDAPKGKKKNAWLGQIGSGPARRTGVVDVGMVQSIKNREIEDAFLDQYGLILIDECHHAAADTYMEILQAARPRYLYGLSATPDRSDGLGPTIRMHLGPVRYHISSADQKIRQGMDRWLIPRMTRLVLPKARFLPEDPDIDAPGFQEVEKVLVQDKERCGMIVQDVRQAIQEGRTPVILTRVLDHLHTLAQELQGCADHVIVLHGKLSKQERNARRRELAAIRPEESMVLLATAKLLGEGFDYPRLDTLMMAAPFSSELMVTQAAGRLHRDFAGKKDVRIYDYVDHQIPMLRRMYRKRLKYYLHGMAYELLPSDQPGAMVQEFPRRVFHGDDYFPTWLQDLRSAQKELLICSSHITDQPLQDFLSEAADLQRQGVSVILVTNPEIDDFSDSENKPQLLEAARQKGVRVIEKDCRLEPYCLIDGNLLWLGSADLLGKVDADQILSRLDNTDLIHELLETTFGQPKKTNKPTGQLSLF